MSRSNNRKQQQTSVDTKLRCHSHVEDNSYSQKILPSAIISEHERPIISSPMLISSRKTFQPFSEIAMLLIQLTAGWKHKNVKHLGFRCVELFSSSYQCHYIDYLDLRLCLHIVSSSLSAVKKSQNESKFFLPPYSHEQKRGREKKKGEEQGYKNQLHLKSLD